MFARCHLHTKKKEKKKEFLRAHNYFCDFTLILLSFAKIAKINTLENMSPLVKVLLCCMQGIYCLVEECGHLKPR